MNTTELAVEIRPEKSSGLYGIWTHDLAILKRCTGTAWGHAFKSRTGLNFYSGSTSTTSSVVFIAARIAYICFFTEVHSVLIFIYIQSSSSYMFKWLTRSCLKGAYSRL